MKRVHQPLQKPEMIASIASSDVATVSRELLAYPRLTLPVVHSPLGLSPPYSIFNISASSIAWARSTRPPCVWVMCLDKETLINESYLIKHWKIMLVVSFKNSVKYFWVFGS